MIEPGEITLSADWTGISKTFLDRKFSSTSQFVGSFVVIVSTHLQSIVQLENL